MRRAINIVVAVISVPLGVQLAILTIADNLNHVNFGTISQVVFWAVMYSAIVFVVLRYGILLVPILLIIHILS